MPRKLTFRRLAATLCAAASGALLVLPYTYGGLWFVAYVAFVPLFVALEQVSTRQAFRLSLFCGIVFHALMGWWLGRVSWLGLAMTALYLSLYYGAFGMLAVRFLNPTDDWQRTSLSKNVRAIVFIPAFWVALEYLRGFLLSGLPWALLAYTQWKNLPAIQISELFGAWGVSYYVLMVNLILYRFLEIMRQRPSPLGAVRVYGAILAVSSLFVFGYGWVTLHSRESYAAKQDRTGRVARIAVLQGAIPQDQKWNTRIKNIIFDKYKQLMFMAAIEKSDLIIWPETSFPGHLEMEPEMAGQLRTAIRQSKADVLVGAPTLGNLDEGVQFYNSAILFGPEGIERQRYHKLHLVPFGEFIPFDGVLGFLRSFGDMGNIGHFRAGTEATVFQARTYNQARNIRYKFAVSICYEDIFPGLVRNFCLRGADVLVNMTNDAWFGKTAAPYQHAQASIFRAVENRVPVVRATNTGLSCFISSEGRVLSSVKENGEEIFVTGYKTQEVLLRKGRSLYTFAGDLFPIFMLLVTFLAYRDKTRQNH